MYIFLYLHTALKWFASGITIIQAYFLGKFENPNQLRHQLIMHERNMFIIATSSRNSIRALVFPLINDTVNSEIFARVFILRNFAYAKFRENKPSRNGGITLSFIDGGKSCLSREFSTSQMYLLMLFAKLKFSRKFPNLQY